MIERNRENKNILYELKLVKRALSLISFEWDEMILLIDIDYLDKKKSYRKMIEYSIW